MPQRDYQQIATRISAELDALVPTMDRSKTTQNTAGTAFLPSGCRSMPHEAALRIIVDALWEALHEQGVSWVGFYLFHRDAPADQAMTLGPSRDTPACSPIGLHGVCGQALTGGSTRIIRDVAELGERYVACDPRDRSEIVLPCFGSGNAGSAAECWGVLDLDSHEVGTFDESDERGLKLVLEAAGIGIAG